MKKFAKITAGIALVAAITTTAGVLAGCNNSSSSPKNGTGEAYGLVHGGSYVGYSKIVYEDNKVTDLILTEVCFPTQVKASATGTDVVEVAGTSSTSYYYKTVSYGSVTLTYDVEAKGYKVGSKTFAEYLLENEANLKAYYEAVINNQVKVKIGEEQNSELMSKSKLSKEDNGYWSTNGVSNWKRNRDATVDYVKVNGTSNLKKLQKNDDKYWAYGGVTTGATWNDLNPTDKKGKTYDTYAELILKAEKNIK